MRIGLDAGAESLIILQLKSERGRLRPKTWYRPSRGADLRLAKKGFEQQMVRRMAAMRTQLVGSKEALKKLKDKELQKRQLTAGIKQLEKEIELAETFTQSWLAARTADLAFRIFRKIDEQELDLVRYGGVVAEE